MGGVAPAAPAATTTNTTTTAATTTATAATDIASPPTSNPLPVRCLLHALLQQPPVLCQLPLLLLLLRRLVARLLLLQLPEVPRLGQLVVAALPLPRAAPAWKHAAASRVRPTTQHATTATATAGAAATAVAPPTTPRRRRACVAQLALLLLLLLEGTAVLRLLLPLGPVARGHGVWAVPGQRRHAVVKYHRRRLVPLPMLAPLLVPLVPGPCIHARGTTLRTPVHRVRAGLLQQVRLPLLRLQCEAVLLLRHRPAHRTGTAATAIGGRAVIPHERGHGGPMPRVAAATSTTTTTVGSAVRARHATGGVGRRRGMQPK